MPGNRTRFRTRFLMRENEGQGHRASASGFASASASGMLPVRRPMLPVHASGPQNHLQTQPFQLQLRPARPPWSARSNTVLEPSRWASNLLIVFTHLGFSSVEQCAQPNQSVLRPPLPLLIVEGPGAAALGRHWFSGAGWLGSGRRIASAAQETRAQEIRIKYNFGI